MQCLWEKIYQKVEHESTSDEFRSYQHGLNSYSMKKTSSEFQSYQHDLNSDSLKKTTYILITSSIMI